uniref:Uncharacterized protein n=1 Tax=Anguilla anguilla TaxID=7936 RepID=A0A0E9UPU0_ANGAN
MADLAMLVQCKVVACIFCCVLSLGHKPWRSGFSWVSA